MGDLQNIFGIPNIIKWAILSQNDPDCPAGQAEIANRVNWAIGVATADFENAMRQGRYSLPITGPGASVWATTVVATLAGIVALSAPEARATRRGRPAHSRPLRRHLHLGGATDELRPFRQDPAGCTVFRKGTNAPVVTHERSRGAYGPGMDGYGTGPAAAGAVCGIISWKP